jgi:hypothetical protein
MRFQMDRGLKFSLILHGVFVLMIIIGMPSFFHKDPELLTPIPIEFMADAPVAEKSSAPVKKIEDKKPEPPKEEPKPKPKPKPVEEKPDPAPPQEEVTPEPKPEPLKEQPKPEPKPEPVAIPEPKPEAVKLPEKKPEPPKKKEEPKPEPKPKEKPKPKKKDEKPQEKKNRLSSVLKNLKKEVEDNTPTNEDKLNDIKDTVSSPVSSNNVSDVLTQDELSALRRQIAACWNIPAGSKDAKELVIEVRVWTNPDRTVRNAEVVDTGRMARDPYFRTAAESALRAVRHSNCNPLMLPANKYDQWKEFTFVFNPQDML